MLDRQRERYNGFFGDETKKQRATEETWTAPKKKQNDSTNAGTNRRTKKKDSFSTLSNSADGVHVDGRISNFGATVLPSLPCRPTTMTTSTLFFFLNPGAATSEASRANEVKFANSVREQCWSQAARLSKEKKKRRFDGTAGSTIRGASSVLFSLISPSSFFFPLLSLPPFSLFFFSIPRSCAFSSARVVSCGVSDSAGQVERFRESRNDASEPDEQQGEKRQQAGSGQERRGGKKKRQGGAHVFSPVAPFADQVGCAPPPSRCSEREPRLFFFLFGKKRKKRKKTETAAVSGREANVTRAI